MKAITILIPTCNRLAALAVTLMSLHFQKGAEFDIVISDQSDRVDFAGTPFIAVVRLLRLKGVSVSLAENLPRRGMAQQRQFLLSQSHTPYSLFLDDDLILEPYVIRNLLLTIRNERCGFVGAAPTGLSHIHDYRPADEKIELWKGRVKPEKIIPQSELWERSRLHSAANLYHAELGLRAAPDNPQPYKIAWVGGCVLYHTKKLKAAGGFRFKSIPENHCGEDAAAQIRVMEKYGGCGIIPSGVYHQEVPTTIEDRGNNLPELLYMKDIA